MAYAPESLKQQSACRDSRLASQAACSAGRQVTALLLFRGLLGGLLGGLLLGRLLLGGFLLCHLASLLLKPRATTGHRVGPSWTRPSQTPRNPSSALSPPHFGLSSPGGLGFSEPAVAPLRSKRLYVKAYRQGSRPVYQFTCQSTVARPDSLLQFSFRHQIVIRLNWNATPFALLPVLCPTL